VKTLPSSLLTNSRLSVQDGYKINQHGRRRERETGKCPSLRTLENTADNLSQLQTIQSEAEFAPQSPTDSAAIEKALVWKQDLRIVPLSAGIYLLCYLDRSNIGMLPPPLRQRSNRLTISKEMRKLSMLQRTMIFFRTLT